MERRQNGQRCKKPCHHDTSRIAWAKLLDQVGEGFPLACSTWGGDVRLVSSITKAEAFGRFSITWVSHLSRRMCHQPGGLLSAEVTLGQAD